MDMQPAPEPSAPGSTLPFDRAMTRRGLLRAGALTGGGLVAATLAACAPAAATRSGWVYGTTTAAPAATPPPAASQAPSVAPSHDASHEPAPSGSAAPSPSGAPVDHDATAKAAVERFLGGEATQVEGYGNQPLEPRIEGGVKVFELTIEEIDHRIDAQKEPLEALGFNGTWPGPRLTRHRGRPGPGDVHEQHDRVDRHPLPRPEAARTRWTACRTSPRTRSSPARSFTYEFVARTSGSHMYHSHHNATDQVGRGLLGAFIVEPKDPAQRYDRLYGATQDIVWISNDALGRLHDQRPRLPGHGADRRERSARRSSSGS